MISVYSRIIRMTAFFIFPIMTLLALLADPFIRLVLTEKWLPTVVLLQWLSFARMVSPISSVNMNILNAVGRSDLFLKVDLSKFPLLVLTLIITIPLGVKSKILGRRRATEPCYVDYILSQTEWKAVEQFNKSSTNWGRSYAPSTYIR